jgi:hypothetical protein
VISCFQDVEVARTTEGVFQWHDVFPEQIGLRVDSVKVDKPTREFRLPWKPTFPDELWPKEDGLISMKSTVSFQEEKG